MVPQRRQERHEAKAASPRRPGKPQEADFPAMMREVVANLEAKIEQKLDKTTCKIIEFLISALMRKMI